MPPSRTTASGGSDPRTATSLVLFEEFVPLEYRQELAVTSSNRRRLPSLFSPSSKSKQWKQAPTLNGRPYIVGHVPRSPSYREVEFEGLLRGGTGTKVISLGKNPTRPSTRVMSSASTALPDDALAAPLLAGISSPTHTRRPDSPLPPLKSEDLQPDATTSPKKTSRFRLPGGIPVPSPGGSRKAGMVPAEYSSVDFETRLASYSDDEYSGDRNGGLEAETAKQKRRESKDDAWVDILVGTQSRRMGGQDAELKRGDDRRKGIRARRSDPDLASLEVAQALAAVRDRSPSPPTDDDRDGHEHFMEPVLDFDVDEIETVPRTSGGRSVSVDESVVMDGTQLSEVDTTVEEEEVGEPPLSKRQMARQQRRLGYFDLHPERRPASYNVADEDPRIRLAHSDSEDDDDDDGDDIYGPPEDERPPMLPPKAATTSSPMKESSPILLSSPLVRRELEETRKAEPHSKVDPVVYPPSISHNGNGNGTIPKAATPSTKAVTPSTKAATPSKTAALIEMYRERERGTSPKPAAPSQVPSPIPPSRLPVRAASLAKEGPASPAPPVQPAAPSPKASPPQLSLDVIDIPPRVPVDESGRSSPARYVHGAPLHNVLEEEEEEV